ncbi:MAG: helix-turn-helix domain-containing protein, partial [Planctomycetes bacterium]|nr:helix-turn-helix domain-containing protein [Planctomycetota bacterium]
MLKLSRSKVYDLKEKIGYLKLGGSVRFTEDDVRRYLDRCRVEVNGTARRRRTARPRLKHLKLKHL